jgi:hypothetical protein
MGQHDPLDGYITYIQLLSTAKNLLQPVDGPNLANEVSQLSTMINKDELATADPLGIGGLLIDAYRVNQLTQQGATIDEDLLEILLSASLSGLQYYARGRELRLPSEYRLAFRELGLAIGLYAVELMWQRANNGAKQPPIGTKARTQLQALIQYVPMRDEIESFWRDPEHRRVSTWSEHRDINEVMLATSLAPDGFLVLVSF